MGDYGNYRANSWIRWSVGRTWMLIFLLVGGSLVTPPLFTDCQAASDLRITLSAAIQTIESGKVRDGVSVLETVAKEFPTDLPPRVRRGEPGTPPPQGDDSLGTVETPTLWGRVRVFDALGDAYMTLKDSHHAVNAYEAALDVRRRVLPPNHPGIAGVHSTAAEACRMALDWACARKHVARALANKAAMSQRPIAADLYRLSASVYDCQGEGEKALRAFQSSLLHRTPASPTSIPSSSPHPLLPPIASYDTPQSWSRDALMLVDLLEKVGEVEKSDSVAYAVMEAGPWEHRQQLPARILPQLRAKPVWEPEGEVYEVVKLLEENAEELRKEERRLREEGKMEVDTTCIHNATTGTWLRFPINGFWGSGGRDEHGCRVEEAPVVCALWSELNTKFEQNSAGLVVLRAGYSALSPHTHLRHHYGTTNGQLKLHLGLDIPHGDPNPSLSKPPTAPTPPQASCAAMDVGGVTLRWENGRVIHFDDSFRHGVWNGCDSWRTVFQVVFAHPDLVTAASTNAASRKQVRERIADALQLKERKSITPGGW